ncbi:GNAT family N-acetyltransferase [Priestia koreensis]|uniref:GNAT family N-acetyltransferase n=1 Tax=Priestia koreensis TaxID=284581 RepID=UPI00345AC789
MIYIVEACIKDQDFLREVYIKSREEEVNGWGLEKDEGRKLLFGQANAQIASYINQFPHAEYQVIYMESKAVGRIIMNQTDNEIRLVDLSILPSFQRRGIGTTVISLLQKRAKALRVPLRLSVLITNPAQRLYKSFGFSRVGGNELYDYLEWAIF